MKGCLSILLGAIIQLSFGQNVEIAFRLTEKDLIPEGITFDPEVKSTRTLWTVFSCAAKS